MLESVIMVELSVIHIRPPSYFVHNFALSNNDEFAFRIRLKSDK